MSEVSKKLKFESCWAVSKNGRVGGLAILQNNNVNVRITSFSSHHIDT